MPGSITATTFQFQSYQDAFSHRLWERRPVLGLVEAPREEDDGDLVAGALLLPAIEHLSEKVEGLVVVEVSVGVKMPHLGAHLWFEEGI